MPRQPQVRVRDKETGLEYLVSEARYHRTPQFWDRLGPGSPKPKTTVADAAAKKKAKSGQSADSNQEES